MKKLTMFLATTLIALPLFAQTQVTSFSEHGGGNGGDDLEVEIKKRALQISFFIKSPVGSKEFNMLNPAGVTDVVNKADFDVVDRELTDKYGAIRTCLNYPERALVECNFKKINELKVNKKEDILTAVIFHEILGLLGLELGYQENVSLYPVSSKILPYTPVVIQTPISDADIRPEYYALEGKSYGVTITNKETKETLRMICLNSNIDINRCRNYTIVRSANGLQSPLIPGIVAVSPADLAKVQLDILKPKDLEALQAKLKKIQERGFKFLTLKGRISDEDYPQYRYGTGLAQIITGDEDPWSGILVGAFIGITEVDTVVEAGKQVLNLGIWPIKGLINGVRAMSTKHKIKKFNKKINTARDVLNLQNELNLVGTSKKISDADYKIVIELITQAIINARQVQ